MISKSLRARLSMFTLSILASLLGGEALVRAVLPQPITLVAKGLYQLEPPNSYRLSPGFHGMLGNGAEFNTAIRTNALGLRGPEVRADRPELRILVLGDSYTFGWAVEEQESYPAVLAQLLAADRLDTEVLNAGVPGWGQPQELVWLKQFGPGLKPDVLLMGVFLGNDLLDATEKHRPGQLSPEAPEAGATHGLGLWSYRHSHLWRLANRAGLTTLLGLPEPFMMTFLKDMLETYRKEPSALTLEGRAKSRDALERLRDLANAQGIRMIAILIPDQLQSDQVVWDRALGFLDKDPALYDRDTTRNYFRGVLEELDIPTIDLVPSLRAAMDNPATAGGFFYQNDPHWTAKTHRLAAATIHQELTERALLPRPANR